MKLTQSNTKKMEAQLDRWRRRLDELMTDAEIQAKEIAYRDRIEHVRTKHDVARSKLDAVRAATSGSWDAAKPGIVSAWKDLELAFRELRQ